MCKNIKVIAMDLDGTLTQHKTPLSAEHRAVLTELSKKYKLLMVGAGATKRIYDQMGEYPIDILGNYGMEESIIKDGKYSFPHEITKLGTITFWVKLEEPSESEDMSDKLIWISKGLTVSFNKNAEGQIEITNEKLDTFNSLVTTLNLETCAHPDCRKMMQALIEKDDETKTIKILKEDLPLISYLQIQSDEEISLEDTKQLTGLSGFTLDGKTLKIYPY